MDRQPTPRCSKRLRKSCRKNCRSVLKKRAKSSKLLSRQRALLHRRSKGRPFIGLTKGAPFGRLFFKQVLASRTIQRFAKRMNGLFRPSFSQRQEGSIQRRIA